jgi:hypothetical protein
VRARTDWQQLLLASVFESQARNGEGGEKDRQNALSGASFHSGGSSRLSAAGSQCAPIGPDEHPQTSRHGSREPSVRDAESKSRSLGHARDHLSDKSSPPGPELTVLLVDAPASVPGVEFTRELRNDVLAGDITLWSDCGGGRGSNRAAVTASASARSRSRPNLSRSHPGRPLRSVRADGSHGWNYAVSTEHRGVLYDARAGGRLALL